MLRGGFSKHSDSADGGTKQTIHAPELDLTIIGTRNDQWQRWVKRRPVDTTIMALKHVLDDIVSVAEDVLVPGRPHAVFVCIDVTWRRMLFSQSCRKWCKQGNRREVVSTTK
jgi:hypothetical protein